MNTEPTPPETQGPQTTPSQPAPNDDHTPPIRVLLVDDQKLIRSGFAMILSLHDDLLVVGEAATGEEAMEQAARCAPDVVLMDIQMPVMDGIEATARIVGTGGAKVIILTTFDRDDYLFGGLHAGASGFLLKNADPEHLVEAIRAVAGGHALLAPEVTRRVINQMTNQPGTSSPGPGAPPATSWQPTTGQASSSSAGQQPLTTTADLKQLTDREREVLTLMGLGLSNREIAQRLFLGEATVKTHVSNCFSKLQLRDRVQAVIVAFQTGLVSGPTNPNAGGIDVRW